jgi:flagellar protein FliT
VRLEGRLGPNRKTGGTASRRAHRETGAVKEKNLMDLYEDIRALTSGMLAAARAGKWEYLAALEHQCRHRVERLAAADPRMRLSPPLLRRKIEIIHQVLADDAEIRRLVEPRLFQLERYLGAAPERRRLARTHYADPKP